MQYINEKGIQTYYEVYGKIQNPSLLLLHGIGADHHMWDPQIDAFVSEGYHVIIPDLLAHGQSSKVSQLELGDWTNQLEGLLDFLEIQSVSIIGVSMGGVIAQYYVTNHSDRVHKIIVSDSFGELKTVSERLLGYSQVLGFNMFKLLGNKYLAKGMSFTYKSDFAYRAKEYFESTCQEIDLDQMILARKAINKIDILDKLKPLSITALVLVGSEFGKGFVSINRKIADALDSDLVILENSMDPSNLVNPEKFNEIVLTFLKS